MTMVFHPNGKGMKNHPFGSLNKKNASNLTNQRIKNRIQLLTILENIDCKACGKCCNGEMYQHVKVYSDDPNLVSIQKKLNKKAKKLYVINEYCILDCRSGCTFLDHNSCSIYQNRPEICTTYPFGIFNGTITLTDRCPPIRKVANEISNFLYLADLVIDIDLALSNLDAYACNSNKDKIMKDLKELKESGYDTYLVPFLGKSLISIFIHIRSGRIGYNKELAAYLKFYEDEIGFPIHLSD